MQEEKEIIINLSLDLDEVNLVLKALSEQPFKSVFEIIGKINDQANQQLAEEEREE